MQEVVRREASETRGDLDGVKAPFPARSTAPTQCALHRRLALGRVSPPAGTGRPETPPRSPWDLAFAVAVVDGDEDVGHALAQGDGLGHVGTPQDVHGLGGDRVPSCILSGRLRTRCGAGRERQPAPRPWADAGRQRARPSRDDPARLADAAPSTGLRAGALVSRTGGEGQPRRQEDVHRCARAQAAHRALALCQGRRGTGGHANA